jgi:hypothetical protein
LHNILGQPLPHLQHSYPAPIGFIDARPAQFQQSPPGLAQGRKIKFGITVKFSGLCQPGIGQQPICAHHMITTLRVAGGVDQQEVIKLWVKRIAFKPRVMIHHRARAAHFLNEHPVAQALGGAQICAGLRQTHNQTLRAGLYGFGFGSHQNSPCAPVSRPRFRRISAKRHKSPERRAV